MPRTREEVLSYLDIERQYQELIKQKPRPIANELLLLQKYLDDAEREYLEDSKDPQLCLRNLRRMAANIVRCLEKHQYYSDQQEQRDLLGIPQEKQWAKYGK